MQNMSRVNLEEASNDKSPIRFHVLPEKSSSLMNALGSVQVTHGVVKECMEVFFRGAVEEHLKKMDLDKIVKQQTERRLEIAMKQVMNRIESELLTEAMKYARERLKEMVYAAPLQVTITPKHVERVES